MKGFLPLAGVLLAAASCGHPSLGLKLPKAGPPRARVSIPPAVSDETYPHFRQLYESLPSTAAERSPFRRVLLAHLEQQAVLLAREDQPGEVAKTFSEALTLFDAAEIHRGVPHDGGLDRMAQHVVRLFSPQGDEAQVIPALCVRISLRPRDKRLKEELEEIVQWVEQTVQLTYGRGFRGARMVRVMEDTAKVWPSAFVLETLRRLYLLRSDALSRAAPMDRVFSRAMDHPLAALLYTGYSMARAYLRVDRAYEALQRVREIGGEVPHDGQLRRLLERAVSPLASVDDQLRLATYFEERDRDVALRVCRAAAERYVDDPRLHGCTGRLAAAEDKVPLAVRSFETALALRPRDRSTAEALAQLYQRQLFSAIEGERLGEATREVERIEAFYRATEKRLGGAPLKPSLGRAYYAIGHGHYNAGQIPAAEAAFRKSLRAEPSPEAHVQLATIRVKAGDGPGAGRALDEAARIPMATPQERLYWQARLEGLRGAAAEVADDKAASLAAHRRSVEAWDQWLQLGLRPEARAEALVARARSLMATGQRALALDSLDEAVDAEPSRKETYADVVAILATHGHLPEALDAYYRALGRKEVTEYLKTYCTFWVIGLARRAGREPDPLALQFLRGLRTKAWYGRLAKLVLGSARFVDLEKHARTVGERAELYFYRADQLLGDGKQAEAEALWRKVLATSMMAFFEYDMAAHNLRHGPTKVKVRPLDRQMARRPPATPPAAPAPADEEP
ncbi:MAG: hypothetical protein IT371_18735 [Deltaproteobacteria bacterium]|nr:hypothetical protein [Deltaproteobacteria bacterium]